MPYRRAFPAKAIRAAAASCAFCAWACLQSNEDGDYFRLEAGPGLMAYSRVAIRLDDTSGNRLAILYDDSLTSLKRLERLPAKGYQGQTARILIEGFRGARLAYREKRLYEGSTQRLLDLEIERFGDSAGTGAPGSIHARDPVINAFPDSVAVSIRDSIPLPAEVSDPDGDLDSYAWSCDEGAGPRDSSVIQGFTARIRFGVRYAEPGDHACRLRVRDLRGRWAEARVVLKVELDPPWADAGGDTEVVAGTSLLLHARGEDGHGPIVSRSWSIGGAPFLPVPRIEHAITVPSAPGELVCILRVADTDSLVAFDTLLVRVVAADTLR